MKITFQPSDFEGNEYDDIHDCPMARAVKRELPNPKDFRNISHSGWSDGQLIEHRHNAVGRKLDTRLASFFSKCGHSWGRPAANPFIGESFEITDD